MTTELVELADRLATDMENFAESISQGGTSIFDFAERVRALASRAGWHPDTVRMDWLADMDNAIGNVQLPAVCVMNNLHDMRAAIDEAMRLDPEIAAVIAAAPEPVAARSNNSTNDEESA